MPLCWYGEWLEPQLGLLGQLIRPGATVLEIGAGVGSHAIALGRHVGAEGHLLVVEQRAVVQRILRNNLTANRAGNVTVLRDAAGWAASGGRVDELWLERLHWLKVSAAQLSSAVLAGAEATFWRLRHRAFPDRFRPCGDGQADTVAYAMVSVLASRDRAVQSHQLQPEAE